MFALIKREISDAAVFFVTTVVFLSGFTAFVFYNAMIVLKNHNQYFGVPSIVYRVFAIFPFVLLPLITALGARQMYLDKERRISSFLVTLATTRQRILLAKIITGIMWLLLAILPVAATDVILLKITPMIALPDIGFLIDMFVTIFLCGLTCYCFGLQIGWRSGKILPALGVLVVMPILVSLIVIKGFSVQTVIFFVLLAFASIIRTWQKFMSSSL
ncbi:MAG TPA: hypothetical protein ENH94_08955 [Phycisphaerales bacterium]|nr:hypothetical protein [Phycisphaerales bacterium]